MTDEFVVYASANHRLKPKLLGMTRGSFLFARQLRICSLAGKYDALDNKKTAEE